MSRIHEALKKAELERAATQQMMGAASVLLDPRVEKTNGAGNAGTIAAAPEIQPAQPAEPAIHFRFEDLQGRRTASPRWNADPNSDVFSPAQGGHGAEQFRTLRSRLYQMRSNQPLRTVLVTSAMAGEGKTFVSGNLARALARQAERRVLVIDADLRCPRLHSLFGAPTSPGLSEYLRGKCDEVSVIQQGEGGNLCFIPSGGRVNDPSELLSNGRFKTLLERMGSAFDWVLIDSPPCLPVADAGMIAQGCDGVLLVVRAGYTPSAGILKSRQALRERNVVGVVLNAAEDDASAYGSYYGTRYQKGAVQASK